MCCSQHSEGTARLLQAVMHDVIILHKIELLKCVEKTPQKPHTTNMLPKKI